MEIDNKIRKLETDIKFLEREKSNLLRELFARKCYDFEHYKNLIRDKVIQIQELKIELRLEKRKKLEKQKDESSPLKLRNITFCIGKDNI